MWLGGGGVLAGAWGGGGGGLRGCDCTVRVRGRCLFAGRGLAVGEGGEGVLRRRRFAFCTLAGNLPAGRPLGAVSCRVRVRAVAGCAVVLTLTRLVAGWSARGSGSN